MTRTSAYRLPRPLQRRVEALAVELLQPAGAPRADFAQPAGEPALLAPDSLSWRVFRNPLALFVGGVAAVVLELAEPRVRSGVWQHTSFREQPRARMQRTGLAALTSVYGPRRRAEAMIAAVRQRHARIAGVTPCGQPYRASDPELLDWVHATATFGFVQAYDSYVRVLDDAAHDRCYAEALPVARLYGAGAAPASRRELDALFDATLPRLEASAIVPEFLRIMHSAPLLPAPLGKLQPLLVQAAVAIVPPPVRRRLALEGPRWRLAGWQRALVVRAGHAADRLLLQGSPWVQACRRLGLADDWLYRPW